MSSSPDDRMLTPDELDRELATLGQIFRMSNDERRRYLQGLPPSEGRTPFRNVDKAAELHEAVPPIRVLSDQEKRDLAGGGPPDDFKGKRIMGRLDSITLHHPSIGTLTVRPARRWKILVLVKAPIEGSPERVIMGVCAYNDDPVFADCNFVWPYGKRFAGYLQFNILRQWYSQVAADAMGHWERRHTLDDWMPALPGVEVQRHLAEAAEAKEAVRFIVDNWCFLGAMS